MRDEETVGNVKETASSPEKRERFTAYLGRRMSVPIGAACRGGTKGYAVRQSCR